MLSQHFIIAKRIVTPFLFRCFPVLFVVAAQDLEQNLILATLLHFGFLHGIIQVYIRLIAQLDRASVS